jgi:hypothetical protein
VSWDGRSVKPTVNRSSLRNGTRFRVTRDPDDPWANYDREKVRDGLRKFAGMLTPEEGERIKELIYRGREEGTRPITRP